MAKQRSPLVTVVVPVKNEEDSVGPFHARLRATTDELAGCRWEILFVDDGSTDRTCERLLALRAADPRIRILRLSRNFGSYAAIKAGFDHARGDGVISISADLQDPPELVHAFVERWQQGFHIVWGVRERRDDPWDKTAAAAVFYWLLRRLALPGLPTHGMDCGLFDRRVIELFRTIRDKHGITFLTLYSMGFRQARVPYHREKRRFGSSKWPLGKRVKAALDVLTSFSYLPIRLSSYLGIASASLAFLGAATIVFDRLVLGIGGLGWPSVMVAILFLGGVQLLMLGVLGEYIWRINSEVRGTPQYLVMETFGFEPESDQAGAGGSGTPPPG